MKKKHVKIMVFIFAVFAVLYGNARFGWAGYLGDTAHLGFLVRLAREHLFQALAIYIAATVAGCVVLALPGVTFAVLAGMIFGPWIGSLACLAATTLGAMAAFLVSRFFLKDSIGPMLEKNKTLRKLLFENDGKKDTLILLITRLVPIFPYNLQNFAYGVTGISFARYSVLTFLFMAPGVALYTVGAAGITAESGKWKYFLTAGLLAVAVVLAGMLLRKKYLGDEGKE